VVDLAGATHHVAFSPRFDCAAELINRFIASLEASDTSCAGDAFAFPAPARFPLRTADAVPARVDPAGNDRSRGRDRRAAGAAAATVIDALLHALREPEPGTEPGLRGGTFTAAFDGATFSVGLDAARLARDLAVTGSVTEDFATDTLDATIDLAGAATGRLHLHGLWFDPNASDLGVEGTIDGRPVALLVPAT
jgi:hypothetical protein